jgi:four helix bundle protein
LKWLLFVLKVSLEKLQASSSKLKTKAYALRLKFEEYINVMRDFKKLLIWQKGMTIVNEVYAAASFFPKEETYGMRSQTTRSAVSIPTNIAEGSAKKSEKEYRHYAEIALGSAFELETHLLIIQQQSWFPEDKMDSLLALTIEEQKMLTTFINKL